MSIPTKLMYRREPNMATRVWRTEWPGDVFGEPVTQDEFDQLQRFCEMFNIDLEEADD